MKETIKKKLFEDELLHLSFLKISVYHLFFTHRHRCGKIKRRKNKSRKTLLFLFKKKKINGFKEIIRSHEDHHLRILKIIPLYFSSTRRHRHQRGKIEMKKAHLVSHFETKNRNGREHGG